MYKRLHQYLSENKILYPKQFGFQAGHSTEHAIVKLVDQFLESFEYNKYPLVVFIDLSKAFDTVGHSILLKKLEFYSVTDRNHSCFKNYLPNRKQFIQINNEENRNNYMWCSARFNNRATIIEPCGSLLFHYRVRTCFCLSEVQVYWLRIYSSNLSKSAYNFYTCT